MNKPERTTVFVVFYLLAFLAGLFFVARKAVRDGEPLTIGGTGRYAPATTPSLRIDYTSQVEWEIDRGNGPECVTGPVGFGEEKR